MKILILKTFPKEIKTTCITYNVQEIGLAVALRKIGHETDVLCCSDDGQKRNSVIEYEGVTLTVFARKAFNLLKNGWMRDVNELLQNYDIIQTAEYDQFYSWHLARKYHDKIVIYHGPYYCSFNCKYNLKTRFFDVFLLQRYKQLNTTFITKSRLAEDYLRIKGLKNVQKLGVGLNTTFLDSVMTTADSEVIKNITSYQGLKLLYVGTLEERRQSMFLIDILAQMKQIREDVKLFLVGKYINQGYQKSFQRAVALKGLNDSIVHVNCLEQSQLASIYKACDVFLFPTRYDIYGMVLLEAMYFGLPVISTTNGGSDMMIRDGVNGYIIDEYDTTVWVDKILMISQNVKLYKKISMAAIDTIRKSYTWDMLAEKFVKIYKQKLTC